jgi:hypothetical protein
MKDNSPQNPDPSVVHLGVMKKSSGLLGKVDTVSDFVFDNMGNAIDRAISLVKGRYKHEQKIKEMVDQIDYDYLELLLKKVVKNSTTASNVKYQDFKLDKDSTTLDSDMKAIGLATASGALKLNPTKLNRVAIEHNITDANLKLDVVSTIAHEAIHLIAGKENSETGFTDKLEFTSANEAMTELLARGVREAYNDFTKEENQEEWLFTGAYTDDIQYLLTLMVIVARDNGVSVETVIQAFTASYFSDNSVLHSFSGFANISKEAAFVIEKLKHKEGGKNKFDIEEIGLDPETKSAVEQIMSDNGKERNRTVRKALHI